MKDWKCFKTESIRKLINFNFQWTKTLYQNNIRIFFFTYLFLYLLHVSNTCASNLFHQYLSLQRWVHPQQQHLAYVHLRLPGQKFYSSHEQCKGGSLTASARKRKSKQEEWWSVDRAFHVYTWLGRVSNHCRGILSCHVTSLLSLSNLYDSSKLQNSTETLNDGGQVCAFHHPRKPRADSGGEGKSKQAEKYGTREK